jgi:hypothetical protein
MLPSHSDTQTLTTTRARRAIRAVVRQRVATLKAKARFLRAFSSTGNVRKSALAVQVGRRTVYQWLKADDKFRQLYDDAHDDAVDDLEAEARRRAVDGVLTPVYQGGVQVGVIREYSDALLSLLLRGKRPEVFRERVEHTGKDGRPIEIEAIRAETDAELKAGVLVLLAKL